MNIEEYTEMLLIWLTRHCDRKCIKDTANKLNYKMPFFIPQKKLRLAEELIFIHTAMIINTVKLCINKPNNKLIILDTFIKKLWSGILTKLAKGDNSFRERYSSSLKGYNTILSDGGDAIGLSSQFLRFLYDDCNQSLDVKKSLFLVGSFGSSHQSLVHMLNNVYLEDD